MKRSDVITVTLISGIAIFASFILVNSFFGNPDEAIVSFKNIKSVSSDISEPNPEVFNRNALNPTVEVSISGCEDANGNGILEEDELIDCVVTPIDNTNENTTEDSDLISEDEEE